MLAAPFSAMSEADRKSIDWLRSDDPEDDFTMFQCPKCEEWSFPEEADEQGRCVNCADPS